MRYCPLPSVIAVRTFSISAGLEASTVTPGRTASDASRTTPASVACAYATAGARNRNPTRTVAADNRFISGASCGNVWWGGPPRRAARCVWVVYASLTARSIRQDEKTDCSVQLYTVRLDRSQSRVVTSRARVDTSLRGCHLR